MFENRNLIESLYEAKKIVERRVKERHNLEIKLTEPVVISAKEIEEVLNNSKFTLDRIQLYLNFSRDEKSFEKIAQGKTTNLVDFDKVEDVIIMLRKRIGKFLVDKIKPVRVEGYPNFWYGVEIELEFIPQIECTFAELYELEDFLRKTESFESLIITKYKTIDGKFERIYDSEFDPIQTLLRYYSLKINYDRWKNRFTVSAQANAEKGYVFVLERMENLDPITQLSIGIHEYLHNIEYLIYNHNKDKIPEINKRILERIENFCRKNSLPIVKSEGGIIINAYDKRLEIYQNQDYIILFPGNYYLTSETLVESETLKILKEIGIDPKPLREYRISEMEKSDILRKLIIYAGYLSAHEN